MNDESLAILADPDRLAALTRLDLLDTLPEANFDRLTRLASAALQTPISLITLVTDDRQFFKSAVGLIEPWATLRETPLSHSFCQQVVSSGAPLLVADARLDARVTENPAITELGVIAYAGVPLRTAAGQVLGSLSVIDTTPRDWTPEQVALLGDLAAAVMSEIELRETARLVAHRPQEARTLLANMQRTQTQLRHSHALLEAVIKGAGDAIYVKDRTGRYITINPIGASLLGRTVDEVLGATDAELFDAEAASQVVADDQTILATGEPLTYERTRIIGTQKRTFLTTKAPFRDATGATAGVIGLSRDITMRKQAEEALARSNDELEARVAARTAELQRSEVRFRSLVESATDAIILLDSHGLVAGWNAGAERIFGYAEHEMLGMPLTTIIPEQLRDAPARGVTEQAADGSPPVVGKTVELEARRRDGTEFPIELSLTSWQSDGETLYSSIIRDITERKQAEQVLRDTAASLAAAQQIAHLGSWEIDLLTGDVRWSDELYRISGLEPQSVPASFEALLAILHPDDLAVVHSTQHLQPHQIEYRLRWPSGEIRTVLDQAKLAYDEAGVPIRFYGTVLDITDHKALEQRLIHQAFHDGLTGLPNRALLTDRLHLALVRTARTNNPLAVLMLDLDRFKVVNDSLGHEAGNQLLCMVAERLQRCTRPGDTVARFGGGTFTILLEDVDSLRTATDIAECVQVSLRTPMQVDTHEIVLSASIGIALSSAKQATPTDLFMEAEIAMYRAKHDGRARHAISNEQLSAEIRARLELESDLRRALEHGEFRVFYQPIVLLNSQEICEVEALVRWQHPRHGLVAPAMFIPLAEETGLILPMGYWILEDACRQVGCWHAAYPDEPLLVLSVNLSSRQFQDPGLVANIAAILAKTRFPATRLKLEITESVAMQQADATVSTLHALKALGLQIALDDFGTGYSSLAYLKRFPIDVLKIDRQFVDRLEQNAEDRAIVQAIITLAKALKLAVTGEGIETAQQRQQLVAMGCDLGQGYYFARPLSGEAIGAMLQLQAMTPA